ncbi:MAG: DNA translocase FtsK 4TM domain-containing protein [Elusimicrobia bacterium]|nr:DNA translocase FtsK 4TM domain-containing protein [Elusimicrobiota bacterium]
MIYRARTVQRARTSKPKTSHAGEIKGLLLFLLSFLLMYCLVVPGQSGVLGLAVYRVFMFIFGQASFLVSGVLIWMGVMSIKAESYHPRWRLDVVWAVVLVCLGAAFLSVFGTQAYAVNFGGWVGLKLNPLFYRLFGGYLAVGVIAAIFFFVLSIYLRFSFRALVITLWHTLAADYTEWQNARATLKKNAPAPIRIVRTDEPRASKIDANPAPKIITPVAPTVSSAMSSMPAVRPTPVKTTPLAAKTGAVQPLHTSLIPYQLPPFEFLSIDVENKTHSRDRHLANAELLTKTLADFNISAKVIEIIPGPVVTRYDMELAPGIKIQSVAALADNIALTMKAPSVRVVSVSEKSAVGVEIPNEESSMVGLRGILSHKDFQESKSLLTLALGKTTDGNPYVADLSGMPHLLIAGATGSGKSVGIHSLIISLLYRARPDELKFMLIDPKRVEMPIYRSLPHLYDPRKPAEQAGIITQAKDAAEALKKLGRVMELRYEKFAKEMVRNIEGYNEKMAESGREKEFYIVVIIDELADIMISGPKDVEDSIQRLAQMARAVGIHLILATQRPSVNVITGVIKANFPSRIAFQTTSKVDSRVILDAVGADGLLGRGDMLFMPPGESRLARLQGAFVSVKEAEKIIEFISKQNFPRWYEELFAPASASDSFDPANDKEIRELLESLTLVRERRRVSQDLLKAHFGSSSKATNLLSILETKGFINKPEGTNRWSIYFDKIDDYLSAMGGQKEIE